MGIGTASLSREFYQQLIPYLDYPALFGALLCIFGIISVIGLVNLMGQGFDSAGVWGMTISRRRYHHYALPKSSKRHKRHHHR